MENEVFVLVPRGVYDYGESVICPRCGNYLAWTWGYVICTACRWTDAIGMSKPG